MNIPKLTITFHVTSSTSTNKGTHSDIERGETRKVICTAWGWSSFAAVASHSLLQFNATTVATLRGLLLSTVSHCDEESDWSSSRVPRRFHKCLRARTLKHRWGRIRCL